MNTEKTHPEGGFFSRVKKIKSIGIIVAGIAVGVLLIVLGSGKKDTAPGSTPSADVAGSSISDAAASLEDRLAEAILLIKGISEVKVVVNVKSSPETVYAADTGVTSGDASTVSEKKYVIMDGDGTQTALTLKTLMPDITGVAIVCRGGGKASEAEILKLVSAATGISSNRIYVFCN